MISDVKPGEEIRYRSGNSKRLRIGTLVRMVRWAGRKLARVDDGQRTFIIDRADIVRKRTKREQYIRSYF